MSIDQIPILLDNFVSDNGVLAQLVEHRTFNPMVGSSILPHPTNFFEFKSTYSISNIH